MANIKKQDFIQLREDAYKILKYWSENFSKEKLQKIKVKFNFQKVKKNEIIEYITPAGNTSGDAGEENKDAAAVTPAAGADPAAGAAAAGAAAAGAAAADAAAADVA